MEPPIEQNHAQGENGDPIKHVVVLMFENHSFDQMLGCFKSVYPGLEGVDPAKPFGNKSSTGQEYFQRQSNDTVVSPDPKHELEHILNQLKDDNGGFVSEYEKEYANKHPDLQRIMDYFSRADLDKQVLCSQWHVGRPCPNAGRLGSESIPVHGVRSGHHL